MRVLPYPRARTVRRTIVKYSVKQQKHLVTLCDCNRQTCSHSCPINETRCRYPTAFDQPNKNIILNSVRIECAELKLTVNITVAIRCEKRRIQYLVCTPTTHRPPVVWVMSSSTTKQLIIPRISTPNTVETI